MFVKVGVDQLVLDTKYKIETGKYTWIGYYKETRDSVVFVYGGTIYEVLPFRSFYKFVSDNPQWKMERRSVNMIVRKCIGDDHFEW